MPTDKTDTEIHTVKKITASEQTRANIKAGLFSGVFCSALFNPWDRALYLSVKNHRKLITRESSFFPAKI
jgi:hypothetical protein